MGSARERVEAYMRQEAQRRGQVVAPDPHRLELRRGGIPDGLASPIEELRREDAKAFARGELTGPAPRPAPDQSRGQVVRPALPSRPTPAPAPRPAGSPSEAPPAPSAPPSRARYTSASRARATRARTTRAQRTPAPALPAVPAPTSQPAPRPPQASVSAQRTRRAKAQRKAAPQLIVPTGIPGGAAPAKDPGTLHRILLALAGRSADRSDSPFPRA